jgi:hypothetical protein
VKRPDGSWAQIDTTLKNTAGMPTPTRARRRAGTSPTCRSRGYGWVDPSVTVPGVTVVDDDAFPGRLPARHRWRHGVAWRDLLLSTLVGVFVVGYAIGRGVTDGNPAFGAVLGVVGIAGMVAISAFGRPGVRVTARNQPELYALVQDVTVRAGFRAPNRIWLIHTARIEAQVRPMRRELLVGRAVVPCLPDQELRALIAHELALLQFRRARLVTRLARRWSLATMEAQDPSAPARTVRIAADLRPFAEAVHTVADAAASSAAGSQQVAARAFMMALFAEVDYDDFAAATAAPARRWWPTYQVIEDLDDAWQRWIVHGSTMSLTGTDASDVLGQVIDRQHPRLAGAGHTLTGQSFCLEPTTPAVTIRPLTCRQQHRLARGLRELATNDWVRWYTCATAPAAWWSERAKVEADIIRRDVAAVLGREPIDAYETAEVLITRNAEIVALDAPDDTVSTPDGADSPAPDTSEFTPPPILCGLVENALLQRGWRIEHPAIRGVLIGPHGERIDAARSITRTETGFDLRPLRTVLRPGISHAPSRQSR